MVQARKIKPKKNISSSRGYSLSRKVGDMISWESTIERDFIKILEFDQNVVYFESQPLVIGYTINGKIKKYYPDFKVITKDNNVHIYEVKDIRQKTKEDNLTKYRVGAKYCSERNWIYHVITDEDIRKGFFIENLSDLYDVIDQPRNSNIEREILFTIMKHNLSSIKMIQAELSHLSEELLFVYVFQLIYFHYIETDLINSKLNSSSTLKIKTNR